MPSNSDPSMDATFLFKGTIREVKSATMPNVPVDKNTVIAVVDQVLEAPSSLAKLGGHRVTVKLSGRQKVAIGDQLIFHAHGWIFGPSVAVESMKEIPIRETRAHSALLSRGGDPVVHRHNRQVQNRFSTADVVVSGRVTMVRIPPDATSASRAASMATSPENTPEPMGPISEHTPHWREAHIEIDDVHKGVHTSKSVVIRFPASMDVRWYKAPKFQPGHQGFFMLRKHKMAAPKPAARRGKAAKRVSAAAPTADAEAFTCLHPADFQPYTQTGGVRRIIENKDV
ncbi:MAG: copper resistance protein [Blastocatellia bacterium]|nr:copper resistance protein [Blastocatellia bacterium]